MSFFGNIFDKDAKLSSESVDFFDAEFIKRISDFIDEKINSLKLNTSKSKRENGELTGRNNNTTGKRAVDDEPVEVTPVAANQTEVVKRFDLSPKNQVIVDYCKSLINVHFHGQCDTEDLIDSDLTPPTVINSHTTLSDALVAMDELLRTVDKDFSGDEEEFQYYLQACLEARYPKGDIERRVRRKFALDARKFVQIYKQRNTLSEELTHTDYWASRQQLLSGKVVADWIDQVYGPLDPFFGVLLNPTLGRTGPGDSGWVHKILFDDSGPMAYHSAVHDAFGYLITYHDVGPGYDYLGAWSLFESKTCLSGQLSGIKFWKDVLKTFPDVEQKIC